MVLRLLASVVADAIFGSLPAFRFCARGLNDLLFEPQQVQKHLSRIFTRIAESTDAIPLFLQL